jgi:hypothetical protein
MTSKQPEEWISQKKRYLILGILIVVLLIVGLTIRFQRASQRSSPESTLQIKVPTAQDSTILPSAPEYTISILSLGDSGITGTVTFKDIGGNIAILLYVNGLPEDEENEEMLLPVEIRYGTCAALGDLAYPMAAPDAGQSETDLLINLKEFNSQRPMAVVLYRSTQDHTVIACGDIS